MPSVVPFRVTVAALGVLALTVLAGCFRSKMTGDTRSCECCGTSVEIGADESCFAGVCDPYCGRVDLGPMTDAGPDGGPTHICSCCGTDVEVPLTERCELGVCDPWCLTRECTERAVDALCDYSHVTAGLAQDMPILFGDLSGEDCYCGETVSCWAEIVGDGVLELNAEVCQEPGFTCEACNPFIEGRCRLPELTEGVWTVRNDGVEAFQLNAISPDVLPEWGRSCDGRANPSDDGCGTLWPPSEARPDQVCHVQAAYVGERVPLEVTHACPTCNAAAGPCEVDIFDDVIRVRTSTLEPSCDITCPPFCEERTDTCLTPPLPEGTWRVQVRGLDDYESTIVVGAVGPPPGVICGPTAPGG